MQQERQRRRPQRAAAAAASSLAATAALGAPARSGRQARSKYSCQPCFEARIKCDGQIPCSSCFKRCRPCRPKRQPGEGRRQSGGPLIECILSRMDPKEIAELYQQAFHIVHQEGIIDRHKAIQTLREWAAMSTIVGSDVSWGVGAAIASALGISPLELEDPAALGLDCPEPMQRQRAQASVECSLRAALELKASPMFRAFDDGCTPVLVIVHENPGVAAAGDGRYRSTRASNRAYELLHMDATELVNSMFQRKALGSMISAVHFDPADRLTYLICTVRALFASNQGISTSFLKCQTRKGSIRVYLFKLIRTQIEGGDATVIYVEPVPSASRYVTSCPDLRKRVHSFRVEELPPRCDEEDEDEGARDEGEEEGERGHERALARYEEAGGDGALGDAEAWEVVAARAAEMCDLAVEGGVATHTPTGPLTPLSASPGAGGWSGGPPSPLTSLVAAAASPPPLTPPPPPPTLEMPPPGRFSFGVPAMASIPLSPASATAVQNRAEAILAGRSSESLSELFKPSVACKAGVLLEMQRGKMAPTGGGGGEEGGCHSGGIYSGRA